MQDAQLYGIFGIVREFDIDGERLAITRQRLPAVSTEILTWIEIPFTTEERQRNKPIEKTGTWGGSGGQTMVDYLKKFCDPIPGTSEKKLISKDAVAKVLENLDTSALYILNEKMRIANSTNTKFFTYNVPIGFLAIRRALQTRYAPSIEYLCIHSNFRRAKWARRLITFYEEMVKANFPGLMHITMYVLNNKETREFFKKSGYKYLTYEEEKMQYYTEGLRLRLRSVPEYVYMIKLLPNPAVGEKRPIPMGQAQMRQANTFAGIHAAKRAEWVTEALRHLQITNK